MSERKRWLNGYVVLPIFKCRVNADDLNEVELTCSNVLAGIFAICFTPFWRGRIYVSEAEMKKWDLI